jgi:HD-like signal output (HDOD) protein
MELLNRFFSRKKENPPTPQDASTPPFGKGMLVTLEQLKQLIPIRNLDEEGLMTFATERSAEFLPAGSVLFAPDVHDNSVLYLLHGTVELSVDKADGMAIEAGTAKARFPLCCGTPRNITARAQTDIHVLRVSAKVMNGDASPGKSSIPSIDTHFLPPRSRNSNLVNAFIQALEDEDIQLPVLPAVALKLRKAIEKDVGVAEAADIIQLDPAIATRVIHIANSPLYLPVRPITTCRDAVARLGLAATRNLVISLTIKQIFRGTQPFIKQMLHDTWKRSVHLSSLCYVLAAENQGINPDEALLAGLVCDIGIVPFLNFAESFPAASIDPEEITEAIPYLCGPCGARVLDKWDFPPKLMEIPLLAEDGFHDRGDQLQLSDIVMLSRLHSYIGTPKMAELPPFSAIPAARKLHDHALSPEHSLRVLHQAREKIAITMKLFD